MAGQAGPAQEREHPGWPGLLPTWPPSVCPQWWWGGGGMFLLPSHRAVAMDEDGIHSTESPLFWAPPPPLQRSLTETTRGGL